MSFSSSTLSSGSLISPASAPIAIRSTRAGSTTTTTTDSLQDVYQPFASSRRDSSASSTQISDYSSAMRKQRSVEKPNAYVSDADLLGVDVDDVPFLSEPPPPPRPAEVWLAQPLLPRVVGRPVRRASPMRKIKMDPRSASRK